MRSDVLGVDLAIPIRRNGRMVQDAILGRSLDRLAKSASGLIATATPLTVSGGAAFALGQLAYIHTDGTARKAINSGTQEQAYARAICVAPAGVADGAAGLFLCGPGIVTGLSGGTAPALGFVDSTAGTIGSAAGTWSKVVGYWLSATVFVFDPCPALAPMNFG